MGDWKPIVKDGHVTWVNEKTGQTMDGGNVLSGGYVYNPNTGTFTTINIPKPKPHPKPKPKPKPTPAPEHHGDHVTPVEVSPPKVHEGGTSIPNVGGEDHLKPLPEVHTEPVHHISSTQTHTKSTNKVKISSAEREGLATLLNTNKYQVTKVQNYDDFKEIHVKLKNGGTTIIRVTKDSSGKLKFTNLMSGDETVVNTKTGSADVYKINDHGYTHVKYTEERTKNKTVLKPVEQDVTYALSGDLTNYVRQHVKNVKVDKLGELHAKSVDQINKDLQTIHNKLQEDIDKLHKASNSITSISAQEQVIASVLGSSNLTPEEREQLTTQLIKAEKQKEQAAKKLKSMLNELPPSTVKNKAQAEHKIDLLLQDTNKNIQKLNELHKKEIAEDYLEKAREHADNVIKEVGKLAIDAVTKANILTPVGEVTAILHSPTPSKSNNKKVEDILPASVKHLINKGKEWYESHWVDLIPIGGPAVKTYALGQSLSYEREKLFNEHPEAAAEYSKLAKKALKGYWKHAEKDIVFQTAATAAGIAAGAAAETVAQSVNLGEVGSHILRSAAQTVSDIATTKAVYGVVRPVDVGVALLNFAAPVEAETETTKTIETEGKVYRTELDYAAFKSAEKPDYDALLSTDKGQLKIATVEKPDVFTKAKGYADVLADVGGEVKAKRVNLEIESFGNTETGFTAQKVKVINPETQEVESEDVSVFKQQLKKKGVEKNYNTFLSVYSGEPEEYKVSLEGVYEPDEETKGSIWRETGTVKKRILKTEKTPENSITSTVEFEDTSNKMRGYIYSESEETPQGMFGAGKIYGIDPQVQATVQVEKEVEEDVNSAITSTSSTSMEKEIEEEKPKKVIKYKRGNTEEEGESVEEVLGFGSKEEEEEKIVEPNIEIPDKVRVHFDIKRLFKLKMPVVFGGFHMNKQSNKMKNKMSNVNLAINIPKFNVVLPSLDLLSLSNTKQITIANTKAVAQSKAATPTQNLLQTQVTDITQQVLDTQTQQIQTTLSQLSFSSPALPEVAPPSTPNINNKIREKINIDLNIRGYAVAPNNKVYGRKKGKEKSKLIIFKDILF